MKDYKPHCYEQQGRTNFFLSNESFLFFFRPPNIKRVNEQNVASCSVLYNYGSPDALDGVRACK